MNPFADQRAFMQASDQTTRHLNAEQAGLYFKLIQEEFGELSQGWDGYRYLHHTVGSDQNEREALLTEAIDGAVDVIVVCIGFLLSLGISPEQAWAQVSGSNMSKVDPFTGKVIKREDGKVLKPASYRKPELRPLAREALKRDATILEFKHG
jgi:predicted HAD superfamily Cof-like phosphohydrolase